MSQDGYKIRNQNAIHFITFSVVQWVDVFTRSYYSDIVIESLKYCQKEKGLRIHAYCIMPNHIHMIVSAKVGYQLSDIIRDFKKYTSKKIVTAIEHNEKESRKDWMLWIFKSAGTTNERNNEYQFWQQDNHPVECDTNEITETRLKYVHENPVRAGIVLEPYWYKYSSAIDYYTNEKGLLEIDFIN
jgi:putative transposase